MKETETHNVLIAIVPEVKDWLLLTQELWYRIPIDKAPPIIKDGTTEYIAFYHNAKYKEDLKWKIVYWAKIKTVVVASRADLFPNESIGHQKANRRYYKVSFDELVPLTQPIVSRYGHRLLYVPTTTEKLFSGKANINHIFKTSYLEKRMAEIMDDMAVTYEREWYEYADNNRKYYLDFVVFCKGGKIDVECDGDQFHMGYDNVYYDKTRNNELEGNKWKVLRYTTKHFNEDEPHIRNTLRKSIKQFHGCLTVNEPMPSYNSKMDEKGQIRLF